MNNTLYLGKGFMGDLLLSQSTPCPCRYDFPGTCSSRSLTFSQNNAMSECTWHCQLYPARLDKLRAGWQMQSSFTNSLSTSTAWCTSKPLFYLQNRPGSQELVMWIMGQQLIPCSIQWFHWSRNGRLRRWVVSQLTAWELVPFPSPPRGYAPSVIHALGWGLIYYDKM